MVRKFIVGNDFNFVIVNLGDFDGFVEVVNMVFDFDFFV